MKLLTTYTGTGDFFNATDMPDVFETIGRKSEICLRRGSNGSRSYWKYAARLDILARKLYLVSQLGRKVIYLIYYVGREINGMGR